MPWRLPPQHVHQFVERLVEFLDAFVLKLSRHLVWQDAVMQSLSPVIAALPSCIVKRNFESVPALLTPEDIEGLDLEDLAHPNIA